MENLAVIPARSGSKGLRDKNIKSLCGLPLLAYSISAAKEARLFEEVMVSTDSGKYAEIARQHGASVPFLRSSELSGDQAGSWEVMLEVLRNYREKGMLFDTICLLQPTSPLRIAADIVNGYQELEQKNADAVTSVCEMDHSPFWSMALPDDLSLKEFRENENSVPRQQLKTFYRLNGALYIRRVRYFNGRIEILKDREYAYIMPRERSVDIDTVDDFEYAEFCLKKRQSFL